MIFLPKTGSLRFLRGIFSVFFFLIIALAGICREALAEAKLPRVLILNGYHQGEEWSDNQIDGILQKFHEAYPFLTPSIETLDAKRFPDPAHLLTVKQYLQDKYRDRKFDLIMALDNPALDLVVKFGDELFPGVPVVFAGVNGYHRELLKDKKNITGIAEVQDVEGTLAMALRIQPDVKFVMVVHDYTSTGLAIHAQVESLGGHFKHHLKIVCAPEGTMEDLVASLKRLPKNGMVLLLTYVTDKSGRTFTRKESTETITSASTVPVYSMHETRLGHGILGGLLLEGKAHGRQAAVQALRILFGESVSSIPVENSISRPVFDHRVLLRFGINESRLPAGVVIINQAVSFWQKHRNLLLPISITLSVLLFTTGLLMVMVLRMRRSEKALRQSEEELKQAHQIANLGHWELDVGTKKLQWSERVFEMFEVDPAVFEPTFEGFFSMVHPDDQEKVRTSYEQSLMDKQRSNVEHRVILSDGKIKWFNEVCHTEFDALGEPVRSIGIVQDITERRKADEALREAQVILQTAMDQSSAGIAIAEVPSGKLRYVNDAGLLIGGGTRASLVQNVGIDEYVSSWQVLDLDLKPLPRDAVPLTRAILYGEKSSRELIIRRSGNDDRIVLVKAAPITGAQGQIIAGMVIFVDITDSKRAEEEVRASERRFRELIASVTDYMYTVRIDDGRVVATSHGAGCIAVTGYSAEEYAHDIYLWHRMVHDEDKPAIERAVRALLAGQDVSPFEHRIMHKNGDLRWVRHTPVLRRDQHGVLTGYDGLISDITERKWAEDALKKAKEYAEAANISKSEFLANASHDLRTPLNSIVGLCSLLGDEASPDRRPKMIQVIKAQSKNVLSLINEILDISRLEVRKIELSVREFDLQEVVDLALDSLRLELGAKAIRVLSSYDKRIPLLAGDPIRVGQIFGNLLSNALKYTESGEISLGVDMIDGADAGLRTIRVTVRDTGIGIPKDKLAYIFDPYVRAHEFVKGRDISGSGLGLYIAQTLIRMMDGDIRVVSEEGRGSEFIVTLKLRVARL